MSYKAVSFAFQPAGSASKASSMTASPNNTPPQQSRSPSRIAATSPGSSLASAPGRGALGAGPARSAPASQVVPWQKRQEQQQRQEMALQAAAAAPTAQLDGQALISRRTNLEAPAPSYTQGPSRTSPTLSARPSSSPGLSEAAMLYLEEAKASVGLKSADAPAVGSGPVSQQSPVNSRWATRPDSSSPVKSKSPGAAPEPSPGRSSVLSISAEDPESARWSAAPPQPVAATSPTAVQPPPGWEERLMDIFAMCDVNQHGSFNKRELIKIVRARSDVAEFFGLPQRIQQEGGSRELMERFFQGLDENDDRSVSWDEFKSFYARACFGVPPDVREAAKATARSGLEAEFQARLQSLEVSLEKAVAGEVRLEVAREAATMRARRGQVAEEIDYSLPTAQVVASLRSKLKASETRTRSLWSAVEAQDGLWKQLQSNTGSSGEAQQEGNKYEAMIARAEEDAQVSQTHTRQLDAFNGRLQRELQAAQAALEERRRDIQISASTTTADACSQLRISASRLDAEALRAAEATQDLCNQSNQLKLAVERMQSEQDAAMVVAKEQEASRAKLWGQLANLASVRDEPARPDATISDLVDIIGQEWTEASRLGQFQQKNSVLVQQRRRELEGQLDVAREAASRAALRREDAAHEYEAKDRERRTRERRAHDDLAHAQADNALLTENRSEWKRNRPQLETLVEDLRVGSSESKGAAESLHERLLMLRKAVEEQKLDTSLSTPARSISGREMASPDWDGSPDSKLGSTGRSLFGFTETEIDSAGVSASVPNEVTLAAPISKPSNGTEDALIRKAADESELLQKRLLAMEDERASLIRSQEELVQYIKAEVEPIQKALSS